jgi:hypothetical protein
MTNVPQSRRRYPLRVVFAVAAAALFVLVQIGMLAIWMMPLVPLVPVFILIMLGNAFVLAEVVHWAASQARTDSASAMLGRSRDSRLDSERGAETFRDATKRQTGGEAS